MDIINGCMIAIVVSLGLFVALFVYGFVGDFMDDIYWDLKGREVPMKELSTAAKVVISLLIGGAIAGFFPMLLFILGI